MTALLLLPPPSASAERNGREEREAADDSAVASAASRPHLEAWACGLDSSDPSAAERCRDIKPELMVELL
jgi:hypothetical protein